MRCNLKNRWCEILLWSLLGLGSFLFSKKTADADDLIKKLNQKPATEQTLEEKISKPKIEINANYKLKSEQRGVDYLKSQTIYYREGDYKGQLRTYPNILGLTDTEILQVGNLMENVQDKVINSYSDYVEQASNLSQNQKFILLSAMLNSVNELNYIRSTEKVVPPDISFIKWQDSLASGINNGIGECDHITYYGEQFLEDIGIKDIDVVLGGIKEESRHYYLILKTKDGSAVIDSYRLLTTNTKNIEKTLMAYQKYKGIAAFQHSFYDNAEFKYRFITEDGENYLDFVGYDGSLKLLKNALIQGFTPQSDLIISFDCQKYLTSLGVNYKGFFLKAGEIRGDLSSPLKDMRLYQGGYKGKFSILDVINVEGNLSLISGLLHQDQQEDNDELLGGITDLIITTNNKEGFNFGFRTGTTGLFLGNKTLFYDSGSEIGISCKIPIRKINLEIEPYALLHQSFFTKELGIEEPGSELSEIHTGIAFNMIRDDTNFSIDPYYSVRLWEHELGADLKLDTKIFGIAVGVNIEGYLTESTYKSFCPNKAGYSIGLSGTHKEIKVGVDYIKNFTDYDGEIENNSSIGIRGSVNF